MRNTKAHRALLAVRGGTKRNKLDQEKDAWREVQLIATGKTYQEVADIINQENPGYTITRESVRNDVNRVLIEWKRENMEAIDAYIAADLYRLEDIERKVMMEYEKSAHTARPGEVAALMKRGMSAEEVDEWLQTHEMSRDPLYLNTLLRVQMQRMRLLGIDKGNDVSQQTIVQYNFGDLSDDALAAFADNLQDKKRIELIEDAEV